MAYKLVGRLPQGDVHEPNANPIHSDNGGMYDDLIAAYKDKPQNMSDYISQFAGKIPGYAKSVAADIPKAVASGVTSFLDVPTSLIKGAANIYNRAIIPPEALAKRDKGLMAERERLSKIAESEAGRPGPSFRSGIESVVGKEALTPKTEVGKNLKEFADTVGTLTFPLPGLGGMAVKSAAKVAAPAQAIKGLSKSFGGASEETGEALKTGSMLLFNLLGQKGIKKQGAEGFEKLKKELPDTKKFSVTPLESKIKEIQKDFLNVGSMKAESKPIMDSLISDLQTSIHDGKSSYPLLKAWKEDMPEHIFQMKKTGSKRAAKYLTDLVKTIDKTIETSPEIPKELQKLYSNSNQLYSHAKSYEKVRDYIKEAAGTKVGKIVANPITGILVGLAAPQYIMPTLAKVGLGVTGATAAHTLYGIAAKPGVRNALARVFASSAREVAPEVLRRHLKSLDSEVSKSVNQQQSDQSVQKKYKLVGKLNSNR